MSRSHVEDRSRDELSGGGRGGRPPPRAAPVPARLLSLDQRSDPAVPPVVGRRALGEIPLPYLRDVVRGKAWELEHVSQVGRDAALEVARNPAELVGLR